MATRIGCFSHEVLHEHLLCAAAGPEPDAIEEHVLECADCLQKLKSVLSSDGMVGAMNTTAPGRSWVFGTQTDRDSVAALIDRLKELPAAPLLEKSVAVPEMLGRYRILHRLGRGGMGTVYKAHDPQLHRTVAIKVPRFFGAAEQQRLACERFRREARSAARVRHPHVCPIYDVGEHDGTPYVVMAYVDGPSLAELVAGGKRVEDLRQAVELTRQAAEALSAVHKHGIVHRDLKPANILLDRDGQAMLTDFGLALPMEDQEHLTELGAVVGTPAFMAPEQTALNARSVGPHSDIYSLGVVLYRMLAGRTPFEGTPLAVLRCVADEPPQPPSQFRPDLDPDLEAIMHKALARRPEDRYGSAGEFAEALAAWAAPAAPSTVPAAKRGRSWPRAVFVAAGLLMLLGLVGLGQVIIRVYDKSGKPIGQLEVPPDGTYKLERRDKKTAPVAHGTPLDRLDPNKDIAASERLKWLPPEVVAVFGTHAWKHGATYRLRGEYGTEVPRLAFGPQNKLIASAGNNFDNAASAPCWIWEASTGEQWRPRLQVSDARLSLADPQGAWRAFVVGGDNDWYVKILDIVTGKQLGQQFWGRNSPPHLASLSADQKILAACNRHGAVTLWKVAESPKEFARLQLHTAGGIYAIALSGDGKTLAAMSFLDQAKISSTTVEVWDVDRRDKPVILPKIPLDRTQSSTDDPNCAPVLALSRDGKSLAALHLISTGMLTNLMVWDLTQNKARILTFPTKKNFFSTLAFSPDGKQLALGQYKDGDIVVHELSTGAGKQTLKGHTRMPYTLVFAPDGKMLASAAGDQTIRLWNLSSGKQLSPSTLTIGSARRVALGADRWLGVIDSGTDLTIRDLAEGASPRKLQRNPNLGFGDLAFSPNGKTLLTAYNKGTLWDTVTLKKTGDLGLDAAGAVAWGSDGSMAVRWGPYYITIWNSTKEKSARVISEGGPLTFSADGQHFAAGDGVWKLAQIWDKLNVKPALQLPREADRNGAFSPDSKQFAWAWRHLDGYVDWFDTATCKPAANPRFTIPALRTGFHVGFALGGKSLVAAGKHGHILLLDRSTGKTQKEWQLPGGVEHIALSSDGRHLVTANANGTVYVFRLTPGR